MDELYNLFVVKPCWASMVLQGTRLVPGELKRWRRSMAAMGPLAVCICPLATLNEDQVCEVGKIGWHMTPKAVQNVQDFLNSHLKPQHLPKTAQSL